MKKNSFDKTYWKSRYKSNTIGWDLGNISNPIKGYVDQLTDKTLKILIPGAGHSYEAEYLWTLGFKNTYVLDIAKEPITNFLSRVPEFPKSNCLHLDFFDLDDSFDIIIEQTFFCALNPILRMAYVSKMCDLLSDNGKLLGLLFNFELTETGPPFGGNKRLYKKLFQKKFKIKTLETAYNSMTSRQDKELFFIFEKKGK